MIEWGYTITIGKESQTTILGRDVDENIAAVQASVDAANRAERMPGLHGKQTGYPAVWFVRLVAQEKANDD